MRLAAVLLSLSPLLFAEIALRQIGTGTAEAVDRNPLVDLHQLRPLFEKNNNFERWEIPQHRLNFFRPDSFAADKPAGSRRIFVLGGSTVQGRPYAVETAFSTWLKLRLQAASPSTTFEVVNCGGVSYASYRVAQILREVLQHEPDAIVIYTGHNEFLEDREYAEVRQMGPVRRWIARVASHIRLVTWIRDRWASGIDSTEPRPITVLPGEVDTRLDHVGGLDRYVRDPQWQAAVEFHFRQTVEQMIGLCAAADVPLILCEPACDLVKTPPFKVASIFQPGTADAREFEALWRQATERDKTTEERLEASQACLERDPHHAGANYVAGRLHYERGELAKARPRLVAARDYDVCPLRATSGIVDAVDELARKHGVPLIDTVRLLDARNHDGRRIPDGIADPEYFVDHLHPSIAGHQVIGQALAAEIAALGWFDHLEVDRQEAERKYQQLAQQHLDSLSEDYYARGSQRLQGLKRWAAGRAGSSVLDEELSAEKDERTDSPAP
jgi:lysophospholipase L1-like esterase